jgi:transposase-like protein
VTRGRKADLQKVDLPQCRVHKTANVPDKLPKSVQPKVKSDPDEIYLAETRDGASGL